MFSDEIDEAVNRMIDMGGATTWVLIPNSHWEGVCNLQTLIDYALPYIREKAEHAYSEATQAGCLDIVVDVHVEPPLTEPFPDDVAAEDPEIAAFVTRTHRDAQAKDCMVATIMAARRADMRGVLDAEAEALAKRFDSTPIPPGKFRVVVRDDDTFLDFVDIDPAF